MEGTTIAVLLHEFHHHRLGATVDDAEFVDADVPFFDDLAGGAAARGEEIDRRIADKLARGWTLDRLDQSMKAILRAGAYELIARPDVPATTVLSEYLDVADAFYHHTQTTSSAARRVGAQGVSQERHGGAP